MVGKLTYIYGLIDPRTSEIRYVGKTVLGIKKRLTAHIGAVRSVRHKRHVLAWIASLLAASLRPQVFLIEEIPADDDWVEAEQFWISYFRSVGANLCNLTVGGEGAPGTKMSDKRREQVRIQFSGENNPNRGKPMLPQVKIALAAALEKCRANPEWVAWAEERRKAGVTQEMLAAATARLNDPVIRVKAAAARAATPHSQEARDQIGAASKSMWAEKRDEIIAAQNVGKGEEFRRKQSVARTALWKDPNYRKRTSESHAEKLDETKVRTIKQMLADGKRGIHIAEIFGIDSSMVSWIKSGKRWTHITT